jgi:NAD/NADP transhydrogenase beta subunit
VNPEQDTPVSQDARAEPRPPVQLGSLLIGFALGLVGYLVALAVPVWFVLFTEGPPDDTIGGGMGIAMVCASVASLVIVPMARSALKQERRGRSIGLLLSVVVGGVLFTGALIVAKELQDDFYSGCPCFLRIIDLLRADGWPGSRPI